MLCGHEALLKALKENESPILCSLKASAFSIWSYMGNLFFCQLNSFGKACFRPIANDKLDGFMMME